jgi:hypothetical protein
MSEIRTILAGDGRRPSAPLTPEDRIVSSRCRSVREICLEAAAIASSRRWR